MAKFSDYVKKDEELEQEISEAAEQAGDRQSGESSIPERFRGKSAEEIAASYAELEKAYSRQGNDLGKMRQAMDEFLALQSSGSKSDSTPDESAKPVTLDDLYEDTDAAIARAVEKHAGNRVKALEAELARAKLETRVSSLDEKYPGWKEKVQEPEFQNWVLESSYRTRLAQAADGWDLDAAEDLLGLYNEAKGINSAARTAKREKNLRDASLESGASAVPPTEQKFSRTELTKLRTQALRGDPDAQAYLSANAEAIAIAYESGNITN